MNIFSFLIGFGASLGLFNAAVQAAPTRRSSAVLDAGLITLACALLGGRAGYVFVNWAHFQANPVEIPQVWLGGISGLGAAAGGVLGLFAAAGLLHLSPRLLSDALYPMLPPLIICGWLACWQAGSAYGAPVEGAWWAVPSRDETGLFTQRFPLQLTAALLALALFALIDFFRPRLRSAGQPAWLGVLGNTLILCGVCFFRADPSPVWNSLRWDIWASTALVLAALVILLVSTFLPAQKQTRGGV